MTYAKDEFTTIEPGAGEDLFEPYYEITVGVILGINGRTLSASAEYPLDSGNLVPEHAAKIQRFSIATAFPWQQVRS